MSDSFVLSMQNVSISAAGTLLFINPGATRAIRIVELGMSQSSSTTSAIQRVQSVTQVTSFPTLTSATPAKLNSYIASQITGGTAGAAGTCGVNASSEGAGAKTVLWEDEWNIVNGNWRWIAGSDNGILLPASSSSGFGLYIPSVAGGGSLTMSAYLHFVEV
jgi:hypothetical protein